MEKFVVGDRHKNPVVLCVMNKARQVLETRRFVCGRSEAIAAWFAGLGTSERVVEAAVE